MKKILLLGGTRFVGKKVLDLLKPDKDIEVFVASRREIDVENFLKIDRKEPRDLEEIFSQVKFDVVLDFINFSASDSEILLTALKKTGQEPHLISVSTVYVYSKPEELIRNKEYREEDFNPLAMEINDEKKPEEWDYTSGKRTMEAFISQNYPPEKSTIIRFPIILGEDDYTERAYFFRDIVKTGSKVALSKKGKKGNFIFSDEAAAAIYFLIKDTVPGVYNVAMEPALNEREILELYCEFYQSQPKDVLSSDPEEVQSPFFYKKDFIINSRKFKELYKIETSFKDALFRELNKMEK